MARKRTRTHVVRLFPERAPDDRVRGRIYILNGRPTRNQRLALDWVREVQKRIRAGQRAGSVNLPAILADVNRLYIPGEEEAS
jgi:hypothetical protein